MAEKTVYTESLEQTSTIFGAYDANIAKIELEYSVSLLCRDTD